MPYTGSKSFAAQGTQLQVGNASGGTSSSYTTVAEVTKIQPTGSKADSVDVTNMDSISAFREILPTLITPGDVSFDGNFIPGDTTQQQLQSLFNNRTLRDWQIQLPNTLGLFSFQAYVTSLDFDLSVDKASTITAKLTITGPRTFTPGV